MVNFDENDAADDDKAQQKTSNLQVEFDKSDVRFWFSQLEMHMSTAGVNRQWTKRLLLHKQLPKEVIAELKDLLRKSQSEAGATPYKDLKQRILDTFDTKPEDAYEEARDYLLHGKPSQLAKKLINKLCETHPNLEGCCSAGIITGMWREKLPTQVRQAVAGMSLVGTAAQKLTLDKADSVWSTLQTRGSAVSAVIDLDTSADAPALQQVAAVAGRGRYQQQRRPGQGQKQQASGAKRADKPHTEGTPQSACNTHWKYGREAFTCRRPDKCPWANLEACNKNKK